jgi:hypothetical protein
VGEKIYAENILVPGAFVFVYAAVIGWKHLARQLRRLRPRKPLLLLPAPDSTHRLPPEIDLSLPGAQSDRAP